MLGRSVHAGSAGGRSGARTPAVPQLCPGAASEGDPGAGTAASPRAEPSTTQVSGREVGGRLSTAFQKQEGNESVQ